MIIEDPKKRTKSKKNPPDVEPRARPGTTLTTRTTRARDTLTMSAVAMSALTASKSAAIAGGAVRTKRATPAAAAPRSLVVRVSFSSLVLLARSRAPRRNRIIHPRGRSRSVHLGNGLGLADAARCASPPRRTTRGMIRMNIFLFVYPRASSRASSRASRRRDAGVFKRVSRCPRARVRCPKRARCYPISRGDPTDVRRVFDARRGV